MMRLSRTAKVASVSAVFAAAVVVGTVAASGSSTTAESRDFATTEDGRTFGKLPVDGEALPINGIPDLVAVIADNGVTGYVEREALFGIEGEPQTPEEALAQQTQGLEEERVPVYAEDGETVVGEYTIGGESPPPLPDDNEE